MIKNMEEFENIYEFMETPNVSDDILDIIERFFLNEGIDVTFDKEVFVTDKHEKLVDTSIENNPTLITTLVPNVEVYSVFQRKEGGKGEKGDGNPLLYALKKENKYKLINATKTKSRIEYIVKKFFKKHGKKDVTIMIPSTNELNKYFAKVVASHCVNPTYIDNIIGKMTIEEVDEGVYEDDSLFRRHYGSDFLKAYKRFDDYCNSMHDGTFSSLEEGEFGVFRFHKIKDMEMRKVIERTVKLNDKFWAEYIDAFNGKDIIIVDDSITLGNTIKETCKIIAECYTPKSITVLTLLSPLYCEDGNKLANL